MNANSQIVRNMCILILCLFGFLAVFADFIAKDKNILEVDQTGHWHFFPRESNASSKFQLAPLVQYGPQEMDVDAMSGSAPQIFGQSENKHLLGTDLLGRDVFSAIVHGARTSLMVGLLSVLLAALIGIFIGAAAGYYGDGSLKISNERAIFQFLWSFLALIYLFIFLKQSMLLFAFGESMLFLWKLLVGILLFAFLLYLGNRLFAALEKKLGWTRKSFPLDIYLSRLMEVVASLPILFLVIAFSAILRPSIWNVILIIGLSSWTSIAKFTRSQLLSIKNQEYITASRALGLKERSILFHHALPNALPSILIAVIFAMAGAILAESTLSFLGVGLPPEKVSWGALLSMARQDPAAWWLWLFPAFCIFALIFSCNYLGRYYSKVPNS